MKACTLPTRPGGAGLEDARWLWTSNAALAPAGIIVPHGTDRHPLVVTWADHPLAAAGGFTVDSLAPLTLLEEVRCPTCGAEGRIVDGAWSATTEGVGA